MTDCLLPARGRDSKISSSRRMFSTDEDTRLKALVAELGDRDWKQITDRMPSRTARQCRERYRNYLSPSLSTLPWTESEDELLQMKIRQIGQKWAQMAHFFVGRSDVSLKNRWATLCASGISRRRSKPAPLPEKKPPVPPILAPEPEPKAEEAPVEEEPPTFFVASLLWSTEKDLAFLRGEFDAETPPPQSTWRNYGGPIW
jgi:hypothetical protein